MFSGIGGFELGIKRATNDTWECVGYSEVDKYAIATYTKHFPEHKNYGDATKINANELPDFDLLVGGFPCQPFSIAGYREGFKDKKGRGNLFFRIAEIIELKKPKVVFLENVKNLETHDNGNTFKVIKNTLEELGYTIKSKIVNTMLHGNIPQNRERILIVGFLDKSVAEKFTFPSTIPLKREIKHLLEKEVDEKYYYNGKALYGKLKDGIKKKNTAYQWRRRYVRENKSGVVPTLTANMGTGGHNVPIILDDKGIRKLTPNECEKLQGFPESYTEGVSDTQRYTQCGNAVTVNVIESVMKQLNTVVVVLL